MSGSVYLGLAMYGRNCQLQASRILITMSSVPSSSAAYLQSLIYSKIDTSVGFPCAVR